MKIGFTTFCTENYTPIVDNLVESVLSFSKYDIIVYSINFDYHHESDRVTTKRVDIKAPNYFKICQTKIFTTVDCGFDYGLILDCDMVATHNIDEIFNEENLARLDSSRFPLFAKHPHVPLNTNPGFREAFKRYTNYEPSMRWVYASFIFSKNNVWFLQEVLDEMKKLSAQAGEDELIINALLAKYKVNYDIGYNYLPNGLDEMFDLFFGVKEDNVENNPYLRCECPIKYYLFHGHRIKDAEFTRGLIEKIKEFRV
jgi:hypothetical protein